MDSVGDIALFCFPIYLCKEALDCKLALLRYGSLAFNHNYREAKF